MENEEKNSGKETAIAVALVLFLALFLSGYMSLPGGSQTAAVATPEVSEEVNFGDGEMVRESLSSQLIVNTITPGTGVEVKSGDTVSVNYRATFLDGAEFDNNSKLGGPLVFTLGAGQVLPGVDFGILGQAGGEIMPMKVGEVRTIHIAPALAYGEAGSDEGVVPPNTPIIFEIELVAVN